MDQIDATGKKTFVIKDSGVASAEMAVEVDFEFDFARYDKENGTKCVDFYGDMEGLMRETLVFWRSGEEHIQAYGLVGAFLKDLFVVAARNLTSEDNAHAARRLFDKSEGYPEMDGSLGVNILSFYKAEAYSMDRCRIGLKE